MSRRRFLVGGASVAATVAAGSALAVSATPRGRRALHGLGLVDTAEHPAPRSGALPSVEFGTFPSARTRRDVGFALAVPNDPPATMPVVFCLHGRRGTHRYAVQTIRFQDFCAAAGLTVAVASVDGGNGSYWHPRRDGTDALAMLVEEFVPILDDRLGNGQRALLGWSMGGYGALLAAERFPAMFAAVATTSPALWRRYEDTAPGAFDDALDFKAHDVFTAADRLDGVNVRIDCGADDPFAGATRDFKALVPDADGGIRSGFHDAPTWRKYAPDQVEFLATHLA